jgi:predicted transglutaminase-like cysteine proteinase
LRTKDELMLRFVASVATGVVAAVACSVAMGSEPLPHASQPMQVGHEVTGPYAFYDFCRRTPHECEPDPVAGSPVVLDQKHWVELNEVNDIVNQTIVPQSDMITYGVEDYWAIAGKYGDCDKYALTKQLYLRQRGWPMSDLLVTVVRSEKGEGHAILTVRTSRGDLILDNRQAHIVAWTQTPYTYFKRQSSHNPFIWLGLDAYPQSHDVSTVATLTAHR